MMYRYVGQATWSITYTQLYRNPSRRHRVSFKHSLTGFRGGRVA